jgi:hypothetical protein
MPKFSVQKFQVSKTKWNSTEQTNVDMKFTFLMAESSCSRTWLCFSLLTTSLKNVCVRLLWNQEACRSRLIELMTLNFLVVAVRVPNIFLWWSLSQTRVPTNPSVVLVKSHPVIPLCRSLHHPRFFEEESDPLAANDENPSFEGNLIMPRGSNSPWQMPNHRQTTQVSDRDNWSLRLCNTLIYRNIRRMLWILTRNFPMHTTKPFDRGSFDESMLIAWSIA